MIRMSQGAHRTEPAISGISSMATKALLAELSAEYQRRGGSPVRFESIGGVDAKA